MTELEELKNHIEALEKRVEASDKKIALLEETLSALGKFKASKEMGEYIERQQNAIRMADMLNSISDETIDMTVQKASVTKIQKQQKNINAQIAAAIKKTKINIVQDDRSSLKYLKYETVGNEIAITGCTAFDPVDIVIPNLIDGKLVTLIKENAFENCNITSVALPENLKSIGNYAFRQCKNLTSVFSLNCDIGDSTFANCSQLTDIEFGSCIKKIGFNAFGECKNLSRINLDNTHIRVLNDLCFWGTSLENISFPKSLREIKSMIVLGTKIVSIIIPSYVKCVNYDFAELKSIAFLGMDTAIIENKFQNYLLSSYNKSFSRPNLHHCTIYCLPGSKAQEYCQKRGISCRPLSEFPTE